MGLLQSVEMAGSRRPPDSSSGSEKFRTLFHGLRFKLEYRVHSALHLWPNSCRLVRKWNLSFFIHRSLVGMLETCRNVSMLTLSKD